eukprot:scaffold4229_cov30-Tisochrysis_lutea.AAC.17
MVEIVRPKAYGHRDWSRKWQSMSMPPSHHHGILCCCRLRLSAAREEWFGLTHRVKLYLCQTTLTLRTTGAAWPILARAFPAYVEGGQRTLWGWEDCVDSPSQFQAATGRRRRRARRGATERACPRAQV